jgi:hypothetical protein
MSTQPVISVDKPRGCQHHLAALPQPHRERLARQYAQLVNTGRPRAGQTLFTYLIGADRDLAERLLTEQVITTNHLLDAISGQRNEILEQLGPLLLEHGIDPEHIAAYASMPPEFRFGDQSTMHEEISEYFSLLGERVPALQPVAQAGLAQQTAQRQQAEALERQERVLGR